MDKRIGRLMRSAGALGALALTGCGAAAAAVPVPEMSAQQILTQALSAARAQGSVHALSTAQQGSITGSQSDDALPSSGRQIIDAGSAQAEVLLVGGTAYIEGNQSAIVDYFSFPPVLGPLLANRWISVPPSSKNFSTVSAQVDFPQLIDSLRLGGHLVKLGATTVDGRQVVGIRGTAPTNVGLPPSTVATLYIAANGTDLPVRCVYTAPSLHGTVTFSHWGEKLTLAKPPAAVPIGSISVPLNA